MNQLCKIRDIQRAVNQVETTIESTHGVSLNEGMTLCCLSKNGKLSSGEIGEMLGLTPSNTSKVIKSVENKGLIKRNIGTTDKRQMYFTLTQRGKELLATLESEAIELPELLQTVLTQSGS